MLLNLQKLAAYIPPEKQLKLNTWLQAWSIPKQLFFTAVPVMGLVFQSSVGVAALTALTVVTFNTGITEYLHRKTLEWSEPNDLMEYLKIAEDELYEHVTRPAIYRTDVARVISDTLMDYLKKHRPNYPYRPTQPSPSGQRLPSIDTKDWCNIRAGNIIFVCISNQALDKIIPQLLNKFEMQRLVSAAYAHAIYQKHENNNTEMCSVALMPAACEKLLGYINASPESLLIASSTSSTTITFRGKAQPPWFAKSKWNDLWTLLNDEKHETVTIDDMYQSLRHAYAKAQILENANDLFVVEESYTTVVK